MADLGQRLDEGINDAKLIKLAKPLDNRLLLDSDRQKSVAVQSSQFGRHWFDPRAAQHTIVDRNPLCLRLFGWLYVFVIDESAKIAGGPSVAHIWPIGSPR